MLGGSVVSKTVRISMCTNFAKHIDNLLVQLVGPTSKLRKGYDLATIVHSLRQIYFATNIDNVLV
jgi:hypothetical protein